MVKIAIVKNLSRILSKGRKYASSPEGMEIFHSKNPFVGDKLVLNGSKLANGPRTLTKELKAIGYTSKESSRLIEQCEIAPELYPQLSAMLKDVPREILTNSSSRRTIMENMNELAKYGIEHPEKITDIKDWGSLLSTLVKENVFLRLDEFLRLDVTDFKTAENLIQIALKKSGISSHNLYDIPEIIKNSKIPKDELCKIFDNHLGLVDSNAAYCLVTGHFRTQLLSILNKNPDKVKTFSELLETLKKERDTNRHFNKSDMTEIFKHLKEKWQIDFIKNYNHTLWNSFHHIKTPEQGAILKTLEDSGQHGTVRELYNAIENGVLKTKEQAKAYEHLLTYKINNGIVSDSIHRFSGMARKDICKNIKSETDLEILKLMTEKKSFNGEDLYTTHAIIKVLEQPQETKVKILERLRKEIKFNKEAIESAHAKRMEIHRQTWTGGRGDVAAVYGRYIENEKQFQQTIRTLPTGLKETELLKQIIPGEVVEVGSKLMVSDGKRLAELKMDKNTFTDLFISDEHLMQALLGDCGGVSTLDALLSTPKGKATIYQLFEQKGKDIYIHFKDYDKAIKFKNSELERYCGIARGAKGIKMLEQALAIAHPNTKQCQKTVITAYEDLITENGGNFNNIMNSLYGVHPNYILSRIVGKFNFHHHIWNVDEFTHLKALNPKENKFAIIGTKQKLKGVKYSKIPKWHMCEHHYHNIKGMDRAGNLNITNPHNAAFATKVPAYEIMNTEILDEIYYIDLV